MRNAALACMCLFVLLSVNTVVRANQSKKNILILHSYNAGLTWTDHLNQSIVEELKEAAAYESDIRIEYMDTKRYEDSAYLRSYADYLIQKYNHTILDIIIATDNTAFDFLKANKEGFVGETPVVFCGTNYLGDVPDGFTGIIEDVDINSNLELILSLHPDYRKIHIIIDRSVTGKLVYEQTVETISDNFQKLNYEFWRDYSYTEVKSKLTTLEEGDIVLLLIFNYDKNGLVIPYDDILKDITPFCQVPIYGVWDFYLDRGIVGGKITSARFHGERAGEIAKAILQGAQPKDFEVVSGPTKFIFDRTYLKKHNIRRNSLPKERIIINSPASIVSENKAIFILITFAFLLLVILIIFLLKNLTKEKMLLNREREFKAQLEEKHKELEIALNTSECAQELQRAFFANVSHEIRTPLNGILGFSDLLKERVEGDKEYRDYAQYITDNGNRLLNIVDNIIEISKIESNQIELRQRIFNLNKVFDGLFATYDLFLRTEGKVKISLNKGMDNGHAYMEGDEAKIENLLRNLLDNAVKFTHSGTIEFGYRISGENLILYVKDTGIGIEPEKHNVIFSHFGQAESGFSRNYQGAGLGLPITKAYVEKMGGEIDVHSSPGEGSLFSITLPNKLNEQSNFNLKKAAKSYNLSSFSLLLAEDDDSNYAYMSSVLEGAGIKVFRASDGTQAVDACKKHTFDLVLMDVKMPEMDGIMASREIYKFNQSLPIIIQTAHDKLFEHRELEGTNVVDFIFKPIKPAQLLKVIAENLEGTTSSIENLPGNNAR